MQQIFPKEIIENTVEVHQFKHKVKSKIIYTIILLSVIMVLVSLPFISLDIYSTARGIIKPKKERNKLISLYSGKIEQINITQNQLVHRGDTLLIINNNVGKERLNLIQEHLLETQNFITDLQYLLKTKNINSSQLKTLKYQKEHLQYRQHLADLITRYRKAKRDFERQDILYKKNIIAKIEHENYKYTYDLTINDLAQYRKQQKSNWQAELTQLENKLKEINSNIKQTNEENKNYYIISSLSGTIQNLIGLEAGSFISAGNVFAEISPNTDLIAECYVSPADIGLLKIENDVKFQIDAFNYNQWGMATGKVIDINKDISVIENKPMFKVVCKINENGLTLKNGFKGNFKKGMTFNARFFLIKRTVFDLLYDKIDDWFIPGNQ